MQRAQNCLFSKEFPLFQQKKPEVPPPSTNPFLEDETGAETDEIVIEKSDTDKVSLTKFSVVCKAASVRFSSGA